MARKKTATNIDQENSISMAKQHTNAQMVKKEPKQSSQQTMRHQQEEQEEETGSIVHSQIADLSIHDEPSNSAVSDTCPPKRQRTQSSQKTKSKTKSSQSKSTQRLASGEYQSQPDVDEVRLVRSGYSRLLGQMRNNRSQLVQEESSTLRELVDEANELIIHVHTTTDAALDSRFVALSAEVGAEKVAKLSSGMGADLCFSDVVTLFKGTVFSNGNSHNEVDSSELNMNSRWRGPLVQLASLFWKGVRISPSMLPHFHVDESSETSSTTAARSTRATRNTTSSANAEAISPAVLDLNDASAMAANRRDDVTARRVKAVYGCLPEDGSCVPLHQFITDPRDFASTVENLFYLSFLANENLVDLLPMDTDSTATPDGSHLLVRRRNRQQSQSNEGGGSGKAQIILSLSMDRWTRSIAEFNLVSPMIVFDSSV